MINLSPETKSCPYCGSYNINKNKCNDCGRDTRNQGYSQISTSQGYQERRENPNTSGQIEPGWYELTKDSVYDETGNKICSRKFGITRIIVGSVNFKTTLGSLKLDKNQPDIIDIYDSNNTKLGKLLLKEKDSYVLDIPSGSFSMDPIGNFPFNVVDNTGESIISIRENPEGYTTRLGVPRPSYLFYSTGKVQLDVAILIVYFVTNFYSFIFAVKPTSNYTFTVKGTLGFKFYNSHGELYAKTSGISKWWWIIGILTFWIFIGVFIILYASTRTRNKGIIVLEQTGEKIASFKSNFSFSQVEFQVPSRNWYGSIHFNTKFLSRNLNIPEAIITTSDGDYSLKLYTIVEDSNKKKILTVYGIANNFVIVSDERFDDYKSLVLATIIIRRYLLPQKSN